LGGIHGGEEEGDRELTGRCRLGRQQRTEWWTTWGAAGPGTLLGGGDRQHQPWLPSPSCGPAAEIRRRHARSRRPTRTRRRATRVSPWSSMARPATTTRGSMAGIWIERMAVGRGFSTRCVASVIYVSDPILFRIVCIKTFFFS
jgi:hypothetical protein